MYQAFARNDPELRARRKLERAAARRRNDQNWGAIWGAPAAAPEPVAVVPPPALPDDAAAPVPAPETAARDAEQAAALVALLRARDEPAAAAALSHSRKVKLVAMCEAYDANSDDRLPLQRLCDVELSGISAQAELAAEALTKRWRARLDGGETVIGEAAVMADWLALPTMSDDEFEAIVDLLLVAAGGNADDAVMFDVASDDGGAAASDDEEAMW